MDLVLRLRQFQRAREMYQAAVYAIGMTAMTEQIFWVSPGKLNETPDAYLIWKSGHNNLNVECVEITLWEEHINDLWKVIEKKIKKYYHSNFSILIHASRDNENSHSSYFQEIHNKLKTLDIPANAIRIWFEIKNKPPKDLLIGELYPNSNFTEFQSEFILNKYYNSPSIMKIDVISKRPRVIFTASDLNVTLPKLPDLKNSY